MSDRHHPGQSPLNGPAHVLRMRRIGIDTYLEPVVYMRSDCHICRSEGFEAHSRIEVWRGGQRIIATLNVVHSPLLALDEAGLSEAAWRALGGVDGEQIKIFHPQPVQSFSYVRGKIFGKPIDAEGAGAIMRDIVDGRYSDMEMAAFIATCAGNRMDTEEITAFTRAMINVGKRLEWGRHPVVDKHCVGGLPGNRTTLIVVPIVAACGLTIPKTSSRAITSPAGSADTMETLAPVALDLARIRRVVERENGCIAWGGAVSLSPADDILIRVERPLGLDSDGQLVASVLSKKAAAGSTHALIDIPVGPTAKVRSAQAAQLLGERLIGVGRALGIEVQTIVTDGRQPIGRGIGPALEAHDVLAVLQNLPDAPDDLRQRALLLAGKVLEMGGKAPPEKGLEMAHAALASGAAWKKFQAICDAQGGMRTPPTAAYKYVLAATVNGRVMEIDNRRLARAAKLAGAPKALAAGIVLHAALDTTVQEGQPLLTIHAESPGELAYAKTYVLAEKDMILINEDR
ncbi:thymidine phosphorylase family protein [Noviherbaspirillum sp. UKPF54]|uniref:thymidine phosphorylase family protein n=1 Tax=Noviherbaspirillum sp. UKPF54 TaxID=2601898 RepID=UPI0011B12F0A|nr:thymidine phosphorylase family protein [Noviherbaspirillum sp. UKPF54]QDZ27816.1 thymidine phosphorylase family protein [Noviherbaspirillum sp. UKPF54]